MSNSATTTDEPGWTSIFHLVIHNADRNAILMLPDADGWILPHLKAEAGLWVAEAGELSRLIQDELDLDFSFTILRHLDLTWNEQERRDLSLPVLEISDPPTEAPLHGRWLDQSALTQETLARVEHRSSLITFLNELSGRASEPALRSPWMREGWFDTAARWMAETMKELGYDRTGPIEQVKHWSLSSVLRTQSSAGTIYFKSTIDLELFVNEPLITGQLATLFPDHVAAPLSILPQSRWMLMEDLGPSVRESSDRSRHLAPAMIAFAQMQVASIQHVEALLTVGCIDRRLPILVEQLEPLLADPVTDQYVDTALITELQEKLPMLKEICLSLAEDDLPATLLHGDLHLGNLTLRNDRYSFFDWSDACISHPFLDLFEIFFHSKGDEPRVRDAYLAQWSEFMSPERLHKIWERAKPICALHHAVSYLNIIKNLEPVARVVLVDGLTSNLGYAALAVRTPEP